MPDHLKFRGIFLVQTGMCQVVPLNKDVCQSTSLWLFQYGEFSQGITGMTDALSMRSTNQHTVHGRNKADSFSAHF